MKDLANIYLNTLVPEFGIVVSSTTWVIAQAQQQVGTLSCE